MVAPGHRVAGVGGRATVAGAPVRGVPTGLLAIWVIGLGGRGDRAHRPARRAPLSTAANVHRYRSVTGFVCLPIAVVLLAAGGAGSRRGRGCAVGCGDWALACGIGLGLLWYVAFPGGRVLMGLVERGLLAVEITMLVLLASALLRLTKPATASSLVVASAALAPVSLDAVVSYAGPVRGRPAPRRCRRT